MELNIDPRRTAVLALDFQNDIVDATPDVASVLAQACRVLDAARRRGVAVVYVTVSFRADYADVPAASPLLQGVRQHGMLRAGTPGAAIHAALAPQPGELVVNKTSVDPFLTSNLEQVLRNADARTLILMGLWTNYVVESTARHASDLGYRVIVVSDACASNRAESHRFAVTVILPHLALVASTDAVVEALG